MGIRDVRTVCVERWLKQLRRTNPGGPFISLWTSAFHGALLTPDYSNYVKEGTTT
jgi:hypothetical protein